MTTTFLLARHAAHDRLNKVLCGRMPGVTLAAAGQAQAEALADVIAQRLSGEPPAAVQSSPLERARETAGPISRKLGRPLEVAEAITEIDLGAWSGQTFEALQQDPRWAVWNSARSVARPPQGESMLEVQARVVGHLEALRARHPEGCVVLVSHADVIKAALAYHLGLSLDALMRFEISPASLSTLVVGDWGAKVLGLNEVPAGLGAL